MGALGDLGTALGTLGPAAAAGALRGKVAGRNQALAQQRALLEQAYRQSQSQAEWARFALAQHEIETRGTEAEKDRASREKIARESREGRIDVAHLSRLYSLQQGLDRAMHDKDFGLSDPRIQREVFDARADVEQQIKDLLGGSAIGPAAAGAFLPPAGAAPPQPPGGGALYPGMAPGPPAALGPVGTPGAGGPAVGPAVPGGFQPVGPNPVREQQMRESEARTAYTQERTAQLPLAATERTREFDAMIAWRNRTQKGNQTYQQRLATVAERNATAREAENAARLPLQEAEAELVRLKITRLSTELPPEIRDRLASLIKIGFAYVTTASGRRVLDPTELPTRAREEAARLLKIWAEVVGQASGGAGSPAGATGPSPGARAGTIDWAARGRTAIALGNMAASLSGAVAKQAIDSLHRQIAKIAVDFEAGLQQALATAFRAGFTLENGRLDPTRRAREARRTVARILKNAGRAFQERATMPAAASPTAGGGQITPYPRSAGHAPRLPPGLAGGAPEQYLPPAVRGPQRSVGGPSPPVPRAPGAPPVPAGRASPLRPTGAPGGRPPGGRPPGYPGKPADASDAMIEDVKTWIRTGQLDAYMRANLPSTLEGRQIRAIYQYLKGKSYDPYAGRRPAPAGGR